ncbi:SAICAR synthase-like protein [Cryphonectria parasitica EP155]|uniref:Kinase n=1 Tax=Cryphonectria parasitica (strain ATCC 38755 / EP155) TaxID=660469 RepID=A0A9P4Y5P0_CRYP1|nr:SAICAR synthase-like protein [Cryphonectria parasitica EP155]KAF3767161.1 SAICAR synthase-like protein [Cryphonectria parasitica EP155]
MPSQKVIPHYSELVEYNYAVAGHDGTMCNTGGELFIKPCTKSEIDFYQSLQEPDHTRMAEIVPLFIGSLSLNDGADLKSINEQLPVVADNIIPEIKEHIQELVGEHREAKEAAIPTAVVAVPPQDTSSTAAAAPVDNVTWIPNLNRKIPTNTAVALDNVAFGFKRPNIMDVKLGRRLWADDAPLEKKRRFDKISAETTHHDLGFRIAGMRVYKGSDNPDDLDEEDYKIYDKDFGRNDVNKNNVVDAFRQFIYNAGAGIDDDYARAVAEAFRRDLEHVRDVLEGEESRMYSSSLLFIFEGDGDALKAAIDESSGSTVNSVKGKKEGSLPGRTTSRIDSGIGLDDDGEIISYGACPTDTASESDSDMELEPKIWNLKLIDFAHATWTPGQGPDDNILLGVRSLISIFEELSQ